MSVYEKKATGSLMSYMLAEQHLYGSSRLGMRNPNLEMIGAIANADTAKMYLGIKNYELSNHLGNVLTVISDKKIQMDVNNDNVVDYYVADIISASDYYPFGSVTPGRSFSSGSYRYGYQKSEKDNELNGRENCYTTHFRALDTRLGRWFSIDPKANYSMSSYLSMDDNPIMYNDPLGDVVKVEGTKRERKQFVKLLNKTTGNKYGIDKEGNLYNKGGYSNIETTKDKSGELSSIVGRAMETDDVINVSLTKNDKNVGFDRYDDAKLDLGDFKKSPKAFQAGMLGHVFEERLSTPGGYGDPKNRNDAGYGIGHQAGLEAESRIVTSMLGKPYGLRTITDTPIYNNIDNGDGTFTTKIVSFKSVYSYGSIQFIIINGISRTPLNDGTGRSAVKQNIGDVISVTQKK